MMMEVMGLHMPGAAFVNPGTKLRSELTRAAVHRVAAIGWDSEDYRPLGLCVDEKAIVNACIGLLATGGSTNHAIHLPAIARAAGISIDWTDFAELSDVIPMLARVYPNGSGDVNLFHQAGGMAWVITQLLDAGLLHRDIMTVARQDLTDYGKEAVLEHDALVWKDAPTISRDTTMLRPVSDPFSPDGGIKLLAGNLGRCIMKVSAVDPARWTIEAPARVFHTQDDVLRAFKAGELEQDVVVVVRFQGPRANGMPELHKLTPALGVLQDKGFKVALLTDGRMSGASGKVPAAIHLSPEALGGGPIGKLRDGDIVRVCAVSGEVSVLVGATDWDDRDHATAPQPPYDTGRELFALFRNHSDLAEAGASAMLAAMESEI
jgi:phosphogluconate dehydratase